MRPDYNRPGALQDRLPKNILVYQESITRRVYLILSLRFTVVSQPFCVDQLNPAGFNVPNVLIRKTPALFLRGKLEI